MVLGTAESLHALAVPGAALVDVAGDRRRADERDGLDVRMLQQAVDGHLVALDDVEDPGRQTGLRPQLGQADRSRGVLLAGLEHDGVAAGDGDREEPGRDHGREVERADDRDGAKGLANRVHIDVRRGVLGVTALQQLRDAAGELDDLEAPIHLAERVVEHFAVLGGDDLGQLMGALVGALTEGEEQFRALRERGVAPGRKGL